MGRSFLIQITFETIPDSIDLIIEAIMPGAICYVHENAEEGCWQGVVIMLGFSPDDYDIPLAEAMKETCDYLVEELQHFSTHRVVSARVNVLDEDNWFEVEVPALPSGPELNCEAAQRTTSGPLCCDAHLVKCNLPPKSGQLHACSPVRRGRP
jgi:hypothetical protein